MGHNAIELKLMSKHFYHFYLGYTNETIRIDEPKFDNLKLGDLIIFKEVTNKRRIRTCRGDEAIGEVSSVERISLEELKKSKKKYKDLVEAYGKCRVEETKTFIKIGFKYGDR